VPLPLALVAAGLVSSALGDGIYTWLEAGGGYHSGHPVDLLWTAHYLLCSLAAVLALRGRRDAATPSPRAERDVGLGLMVAGIVALTAFWLIEGRETWIGVVLAGTLGAMVLRLLVTARESRRIAAELAAALAEHERLAVTDALTGLRNRSAVEALLRAQDAPVGVLVLELETASLGFDERDQTVLEAADRIRALVGHGALLGRTAAAELALIVPDAAATRSVGERLRAAIAAESFAAGAVGAGGGAAWGPEHGATGEELLRAAEQARDRARELGGNQIRASGEEADRAVLESLADEVDRRRGCEGHGRAVGRWAAAVAEQLELDAETVRRSALAGRLHDIGLISAPEALLCRPHLTGRDEHVRLEDHPLAHASLTAAIERSLGGLATAIACPHDPLSAGPPLEARIVAVCNAWATLREGRPGRPPLGIESARRQLLARSGTAYAPDVVRAFFRLEAHGVVGHHDATDLGPVRSRTAASADEILVATAASPATPARAAKGAERRPRLPTALLATAVLLLAGWSAWTASLHLEAEREENRTAELVAADRRLHEIELLRWRMLAGEVPPVAAAVSATANWLGLHAAVDAAAEAGAAGDRLAAATESLERRLEAEFGGAVRQRSPAGVLRAARLVEPQIREIDELIDGEAERAQAAATAADARAWRLTAGSGGFALVVIVLLLIGFVRTRRAAERLRTAAARSEGERNALQESGRRFRALVQHASDSVLVTDADGAITFATDAVERLLGHAPAALLGRRFEELVDPDHEERLADLLTAARRMPDATAGDLVLRHAGGAAVHADLRVADRLGDPDVAGVVLTLRDVSEQRKLESELRRSALVDRRTGLANRARFEDWVQQALARGAAIAMVQIDLDDFKTVNDSLGHPAGDRCLVACAERLREAVGKSGLVARLGSDDFAVLFEDVSAPDAAEMLARGLVAAVTGAVPLDGTEVPLTARAGVALSAPGLLAEDVMRGADTAAHAAQAGGPGHVVVYSSSMHAHAVRRLGLRTALARAVEREELELAYQPIINIESGETTGLEALLRWRTPEGEPISPADFIPVAEASGLIVPLGTWVLERACTDAAPLGEIVVGVNVSAVQLRAPDFVATVAGALERSGLPPHRLVLELTESALMDDVTGVQQTFGALRALGVEIAIDDFGTGFSSLAMLADLPVDVLKLDRSFIAAMSDSPGHEALVGGVLSLADRLGLPVVAEGVETAEQYEALRALGCRWAQGYHLGRPGPLEAVAVVDARPRSLR
jgi:diguanylate cyclase (GGDEF)-like protein/PAS domain S-box-containing protein